MRFGLFLLFSILFHSFFFWASKPQEGKFRLPLRRGEPFEITKSSGKPQGAREPIPSKSDRGESEGSPSGSGKANTPGGISDGSEFGISKPPYPEAARLRGEEGTVLLKLSLDRVGAWVKIEILESSGFPDLDRTGIRQVEKDLPRSSTGIVEREAPLQFNFILPKPK